MRAAPADKLDPTAGKRHRLSALPATPLPSVVSAPGRSPPAHPDQHSVVADDGPTGSPGAPVRHSSSAHLGRAGQSLLVVVAPALQSLAAAVLAGSKWRSDSTLVVALALRA